MPGERLAERWRVEGWLGAGGSAQVYAATDVQSGARVALKVLSVPGADEALVRRFLQEAEHARRLHHPNIARVLEAGSHAGRHFLVCELLEGGDLRRRLVFGRVPLPVALRWLTHAAAALEHAHAAGVLHRDVKPGNLFLTRLGILKLMDFGLARSAHVPASTVHGQLLGPPEYMAPEQVTGEHPLSAATDLYALGVVVYELVTGQRPFHHPEPVPLLMLHVHAPPPSPRRLRAELPPAFEEVILRLLAKSPSARFPSAAALRAALRPLWGPLLPTAAQTRRTQGGSGRTRAGQTSDSGTAAPPADA